MPSYNKSLANLNKLLILKKRKKTRPAKVSAIYKTLNHNTGHKVTGALRRTQIKSCGHAGEGVLAASELSLEEQWHSVSEEGVGKGRRPTPSLLKLPMASDGLSSLWILRPCVPGQIHLSKSLPTICQHAPHTCMLLTLYPHCPFHAQLV